MGPLERGKGRFTIHCIPIVLHEIFTIDKSYQSGKCNNVIHLIEGHSHSLIGSQSE